MIKGFVIYAMHSEAMQRLPQLPEAMHCEDMQRQGSEATQPRFFFEEPGLLVLLGRAADGATPSLA
jgi:hypothetical protein